jgi:hypothetical protein
MKIFTAKKKKPQTCCFGCIRFAEVQKYKTTALWIFFHSCALAAMRLFNKVVCKVVN